MKFVPAGEIIGAKKHRVRTVGLRDSPQLPDGDYTFVDMYCVDPECDCRKTMIHVVRNGTHVATINFGWESPEFYRKWMGCAENGSMPDMHGATIDINSPNKVPERGMLAFFQALLDDKWTAIIKQNYRAVKSRLAVQGNKGVHEDVAGFDPEAFADALAAVPDVPPVENDRITVQTNSMGPS